MQKTLGAIGLGCAALAWTGDAQAQQLPRFDVQAHCEEIAAFGGSYSASSYNGCIQMEQSAYNSLKQSWGRVPQRIRTHCLEIARYGGGGDYSSLEGCIEMETNASRNRQQFKFE